MHIGQAAKSFSEILNLKLSRTQSICKYLREADFVRSGARGVNAPHLQDLEIARILVTLMTTEMPMDAKERCEYFCSLPVASRLSLLSPERTEIAAKWTVEMALAALFRGIRSGDIKSFEMADFTKTLTTTAINLEIDISFGRVEISHEIGPQPILFSQNDLPFSQDYNPCPFYSPMRKIVSVDHDVIEQVAAFARDGDEDRSAHEN